MAKFIRYGLAAVCFAASAGCLALWSRSTSTHDALIGRSPINRAAVYVETHLGSVLLSVIPHRVASPHQRLIRRWRWQAGSISPTATPEHFRQASRQFGPLPFGVYFPLWYPALAFVFAGVGVLRFRRQFSIRTAMIVTAVVAALIAMVVVL